MSGLSSGQLAKKYKTYKSKILNIVRSEGGVVRSNSECQRKFLIQEDFFEKIDSLEKAYFLGLLYADGDVYKKEKNSYLVRLRLAAPDKELVEYFSKAVCMGENNTRAIENKQGILPMVGLTLHSKKMVEDLSVLGCVQRKSSCVEFKPEIFGTEELIWAFILGFFDGDGGVDQSGRRIHFTSNKKFCEQMRNFLIKAGINCRPYKERKNGYGSISFYSVADAKIFCEKTIFKYPNSLKRKREKLLWFISRKSKPRRDISLSKS